MRSKGIQSKKVNVITLGCSKNLVDSENLITQLRAGEWDAQHESVAEADIVVVNTCGFIDKAKQESIDTILHYANEKEAGHIERLYVTGCLSERYKDDLIAEIPEVDAFFGTMELPLLLNQFNVDYKSELVGERLTMTPDHYAYMKISEGCNRTCSFCAIPLMRKDHISRTIESLVDEAKNLARRGVKEIMLIAQESTYYGLDIYKKRALPELLHALNEVEGIEWIRLHYAYPSKFPIDILTAIRDGERICNYLDLPLQHASNRMLKSMKRQITREETQSLVDKIRETIPDIALRTTFLVGFPGETESDFIELMEFVQINKFDRLGVFQYSHEEGTSAYDLVDDVSEEMKINRTNRLMELQREISLEKNQAKIGKIFKVLIDRKEGEYYYGRTEGDSPEVDNEVIIDASSYARLGDFAMVRITDALDYDLIGELA
jgi:ribosomal protein S12 methylthiotransferase